MADPCPICSRLGWWWRLTHRCNWCLGHRRVPYKIKLKKPMLAGGFEEIPADFDWNYDSIDAPLPDRRSPMIRMLDAKEWRESVEGNYLNHRFNSTDAMLKARGGE